MVGRLGKLCAQWAGVRGTGQAGGPRPGGPKAAARKRSLAFPWEGSVEGEPEGAGGAGWAAS